MMMTKGLTAAVVALLIAMNVQAEEQRTRLTKENKFPELGQVELGVGVTFLEFGDDNESSRLGDANLTRLAAEVRFGLLPNLTVSLLVPFDSFEPDAGDDDSSLGDVEIGLQLKAFEDIFDYPYVIHYVTYDFGTGEPYLLPEGDGDDTFTIGVSVGTVTYDLWTWGIDLSYDINGESENSAVLGGSLFYEVGPQF